MKERIKQLMQSQHMTQQSFADFLGVSPAALSSLFSGRSNPTLNYVDAIKRKLPTINLDWLMYGEGEMFKGENTVDGEKADDAVQIPGSSQPGFFDSLPSMPQQHEGMGSRRQDQRLSSRIEDIDLVKKFNKPQRSITEIRIFFDDQTFESFVPKK
ncbi:MAG: helix-turn-helix transcriptional regulator [Prevotella sp.]|nr:helix-turn-helix transcriptional regulator [Prevotella sp.]